MPETPQSKPAHKEAKRIIREHNGIIRTSEALEAGIHPRTLYALRDRGEIEEVSRGVFRLSELPPISNPDLVKVALRIPKAVICLISALSFHDLTTQIPHEVSLALEKSARPPRIDHPPVIFHHFSKKAFTAGIETYKVDGVTIRVYSPAKTLADCFKFRNKLGMEVVLEALRLYRSRREFKAGELLKFAKICRVEKIMTPYLEASL